MPTATTPLKQPAKEKEKDNKEKRLARCARCVNCTSSDCGRCHNCADKPKFGGPGIKKQACVNRKCLLMMPRDEEESQNQRKRAKQRQVPPMMLHRLPAGTTASVPDELAAFAGFREPPMLTLPASPGASRPSSAMSPTLASPRSATSSPSDSMLASPTSSEPLRLLNAQAGRAQHLAQHAALHTPNSSPQRAVALTAARAARAAITAQTSAVAAALGASSGSGEGGGDLSRAFVTQMTAALSEKLGVSDEPPNPPNVDELHETFLLLNAEHRQAPGEPMCVPVLAY